jgi:signal transduction histidine kinase
LLDLASVQTSALHVERVPADLCALAREAAEDHRGAVEAAGHRLALQLPLEPVMVDTDPARVRQILGNLLSNAVKYTPAPGIVGIAVAVVRNHEPLPTRAVIRVSDSGPGIPADQRDRIFDEFERLHSGAIQGHGLGLAISQRIAQLLGADLRVEDGDEGGAVFVLWLPFGTATAT